MNISIIICTYNRTESLNRTLESINAMTVPDELSWELIVVDNNSKDNTKQFVENFIKTSGLNCRYVFEEKQGVSHARNSGIKNSKGGIVAFLDDDVIVTPDWLVKVDCAFKEYEPSVVWGKVLLKIDGGYTEWFSKKIAGALGEWDRGDKIFFADINDYYMIGIGANMSFKKDVFEKIGLFRTDLGRVGNKTLMGEESELFWRIMDFGGKCIYYPFATVYHCIESNKFNKGYLRRCHYNIGEWRVFQEEHKLQNSINLFRIPKWKYRIALGDLFTFISHAVRRDSAKAFFYELQVIVFIGYLLRVIKQTIRDLCFGRRIVE